MSAKADKPIRTQSIHLVTSTRLMKALGIKQIVDRKTGKTSYGRG